MFSVMLLSEEPVTNDVAEVTILDDDDCECCYNIMCMASYKSLLQL